MAAAPVVVTLSVAPSLSPDGGQPNAGSDTATDKSHHKPNGGFVNPWRSFKVRDPFTDLTLALELMRIGFVFLWLAGPRKGCVRGRKCTELD